MEEINQTFIYFVRHAESAYIEGAERSRGLTEQGKQDAKKIKDILLEEQIQILISSPYRRAVETIQELANALRKNIIIEEDLRERQLSGTFIAQDHFMAAKKKVFDEPDFSFPGGESGKDAQMRAIRVISRLLEQYNGKKIAIGTHGDIMTLMMNYYDKTYGFDFWMNTTMPDIYKLQFNSNNRLEEVTRLWRK